MPRKISFRHAGHFLLSGAGPPPEVVLACLIFFGPRAKKFAFTRQKLRRAVQKETARVPIFRNTGPKTKVM